MDDAVVLHRALLDGAILIVVLSTIILTSLSRNAELWLDDYPPDIRERCGPMSDATRKERRVWGALFLIGTLVPIGLGLYALARHEAGPPTFLQAFGYAFVAMTIFNLWDLIVLDWLLFVRIQPPFIILPGTEGMAGYRSYFFHFRAFLIGLVGTAAFSAALAGVVVWVS